MDKIAAVILAAGKGTRMLPLTERTPKPMLRVGERNLIEHKLETLPKEVTEIVLIIGYLGEQVQEYFGDEWRGRPVRYVVQESLTGTAGALFAAKDVLPDRFIVMMGDDLYHKSDVEAVLAHEFAMVAMPVREKEIGGEIIRDEKGRFIGMREERHYVSLGLVNTGLFALDRRIFDYDPVPIGGSSTEFGLPHTLAVLARDIPVTILTATKWMQITAPEDLERAMDFYE